MTKHRATKQLTTVCAVLIGLLAGRAQCFGAADLKAASRDRFLALPIAKGDARMLYRYGVPFMETAWHAPESGSLQVNVGVAVKKIYLLGMTETKRPSAWSNAQSYAERFIVGDNLGQIRLHYADGTTQDFPLILGESVWWGMPFYQTQEPFPTDAPLRKAFEQSLHLYPAAPVEDGNYVAVIAPKDAPLASIEITGSPAKRGSVAVAGITVETAPDKRIPAQRPFRRMICRRSSLSSLTKSRCAPAARMKLSRSNG